MAALNDESAALKKDGASPKLFEVSGRRVFVAGHRGLVGSAIIRRLAQVGCGIVTVDRERLDLLRQNDTEHFLQSAKPDVVIVAAGKVGGIHANSTLPAEFIYENLMIAANLIHGAFRAGVRKLLFLGSSCVYPKRAAQPMIEEELLTGPLESTNEWYAVAKIAGVKLCQAYRRQYGADYISVMPTNVYGPGDNYHPENSHVVAALIRRFHEAKQSGSPTVTVWGTGTPRREFIFVDDLADACILVLERYAEESPLNIGTGEDIMIIDLARLIARVIGYRGELVFDMSRPDGTPQKLLNISRLKALGWKAKTPFTLGLERSYADFLARHGHDGGRH
jgi:GDP-L-fucose synthase